MVHQSRQQRHIAVIVGAKLDAGEAVDARVVNTVSSVGLYGHAGQSNYAAAKAAIASFTITASLELGRYGATVNALCPTALTPMTEAVGLGDSDDAKAGALDPRWVSPALVWLASPLSKDVTGRVSVASVKRLGELLNTVCECRHLRALQPRSDLDPDHVSVTELDHDVGTPGAEVLTQGTCCLGGGDSDRCQVPLVQLTKCSKQPAEQCRHCECADCRSIRDFAIFDLGGL